MYRSKQHSYANLDHDETAREILGVATALIGVGFVGGGAARYLYDPKNSPLPSDIDVFMLKEDGEQHVVSALAGIGYRGGTRQGSARAYTNPSKRLPVQIVMPVAFDSAQAESESRVRMQRYGTPKRVLEGFTFYVEQFAAEFTGAFFRLTWTDSARVDLQRKRLRLNRIASPLYATWRIAKYSRKGFKISLYELQKLFGIWDALPGDVREYTLSFWPDDPADFYTGLQQT